jgi:hypothetical protein
VSLRQTLRQMKQESMTEKQLLNDFQQQKERIEQLWSLEKQSRDDLKMDLRNKLRQKQDLEEKHAFELKAYKQKLKHLLHEHQSSATDLRYDAAASLRMLEDAHRAVEADLKLDARSIKAVRREMEVQHLQLIRGVKLEQEARVMGLRQEYELRATELKAHFEQALQTALTDLDNDRREQVQRLEARKTAFTARLMGEHRRAMERLKAYFRDIKMANLGVIKGLKADVEKLKDDDAHLTREVRAISQVNQRLARPLEAALAKAAELERLVVVHERERAELADAQDALGSLQEREKNLSWEAEVVRQKLERATAERAQLQKRLDDAVQDARQKASFRGLILTRKVAATAQDLEKTEAALSEVLASTNLSLEAAGELRHSLEEVLVTKNRAVQRLEDELVALKQRYAATVQLYEAKLREYSIPVEARGFNAVRRV